MVSFVIMLPVFYSFICILTNISKYLYSITNNHHVWESLHDKFVLITCATTEFGAALCAQLAEKKIKMVILGPIEDKLLDIKAKFGHSVEIFHHAVSISNCFDFTFLDKYDIGLVINTIGDIEGDPLYFMDQNIDSNVDVHVKAPLNLTKSIITSMAEKHKGYVVHIGFGSTDKPSPYFTVPTAIQRAFRSWSESMYYEMMHYNINVEYMQIGRFSKATANTKWWHFQSPSVETVAKCVINTLGSSYFTIPYLFHFIEFMIIMLIPRFLIGRVRYYKNEDVIREKNEKTKHK